MSRFQDLTGQRFGKLVVVEYAGKIKGKTKWLCKCDCGKEKVMNAGDLKSGRTTSCGGGVHKIGMNVEDLTGQRFGRLVVIRRGENSRTGSVRWLCQCDCGNTKEVYRSALKSGLTKSCGCWQKDHPAQKTHGMSKTKIYGILCGMKDRCYNPNTPSYQNYGARGIKICQEWLDDPMAFIKWAYEHDFDEDAAQDECQIERIDVNGDYCPENCKWADSFEQANNKRNTIILEYNGEKHNLLEWSNITGLSREIIYERVHCYHWSVGRALGFEP